jgi:DNA replication and repair protein RecF
MYLENLYLANFKNYSEAKTDFSKDINALVGDNGSGKTNLLDAVHFLSMTKSAFNAVDQQSIRHDQAFYSIVGRFNKKNKIAVLNNSLTHGKRKKISIDDNPVGKAAEIIGLFPTVLIAPNDHTLIMEGGETRRRFIDSIISQLNKSYLMDLLDYNRALKHRNKLLKQFSETGNLDKDILEPYDQILLKLGKQICEVRSSFCVEYIEKIIKHYLFLTEGKEEIGLEYQSSFLESNYKKVFHSSLQKDIILQRTGIGIHKDDFVFEMDGYMLKKFGSQGQQKSFLIALKLAQFDIIHDQKGYKPILLMDDIFDKLDDHRIQKLTEMIEQHEFGQVFITDARPERTFHFLKKLNIEWRAIHVNNGTLSPVNSH